MASTVEALKARGVEFEDEPKESPYGVHAQVRDPDGNVFGLLQEVSD
jgi:predicted enzyme related to lactoylglutathione lyase